MKMARIETFAVRLPRNHTTGRGGAGSPGIVGARGLSHTQI
jgi:hypothetical protein